MGLAAGRYRRRVRRWYRVDALALVFLTMIGACGESDFSDRVAPPTEASNKRHPADEPSPTIDPPRAVCDYTRFLVTLGGSKNERAGDVAIGPDSSIYVVGSTPSPDFEPLMTAAFGPGGGDEFWGDAFVTRLSPCGDVLYSVRLGGSDREHATAVVVGDDGTAYVGGWSDSVDLPVVDPIPGAAANGAFVAAIAPAGDDLIRSSFLPHGSHLQDMVLGPDGDIYAVGRTPPPGYGGLFPPADCDTGFVVRLDGSVLKWATNIGGCGVINGVALGSSVDKPDVYVVGHEQERTLDAFVRAGPSPFRAGSWDALVANITHDGSRLRWVSYISGSYWDFGVGIAARKTDIVVAGKTHSRDFYTTDGTAYHRGYVAGGLSTMDTYVVTLEDPGTLIASTVFGDTENDYPRSLNLDDRNGVYVAGGTLSSRFPVLGTPLQPALWGDVDPFVTRYGGIPQESNVTLSTFAGGDRDEWAAAIAVLDPDWFALTGEMQGTSAFFAGYAAPRGGTDVFVALTPHA